MIVNYIYKMINFFKKISKKRKKTAQKLISSMYANSMVLSNLFLSHSKNY